MPTRLAVVALILVELLSAQHVRIWYVEAAKPTKVLTTSQWGMVPTIGVQYIIACSSEMAPDGTPLRRKFSSADFYCNTSQVTEDGWDQSRWVDKQQVKLHEFLRRTGCSAPSVRFGLMIPDRVWTELEEKASRWRCED
jgi:hypothetical protein